MVDINEIVPMVLLAIAGVLYVVALFLDLRAKRKDKDKNDDTEDD